MTTVNLPSSQLGLNISDPLDSMQQNYAIQMDNLIPDNDGDRVRKGFEQVCTTGYNVLGTVNRATVKKVLAFKNDSVDVYDLSDFTTAEQTKTGLGSEEWVGVPFTDGSGAQHTIFANGVDTPLDYTNSLNDVGFTIPQGVLLDRPLAFKNRLYFIGGDFDLYYGGVQSISGELTKFSMGSYFRQGGRILTIANWTQDAGDGVNDLFVVVSTEGEVLIYSGTSPEADDWAMVGVFRIPRPIGKRCLTMLGADLICITEKGYLPLSSVLSDLRANRTTINRSIDGIVGERDRNKRWDIFFYSKAGLLIVNAPSTVSGYAYEQHVLNFNTNAWCRFIGMDADSWCVCGDRLFFCNSKGIFEGNKGYTDNGESITFQVQKAYNQFGTPFKKQLMRIKPRYYCAGEPQLYKKINVDFNDGKKSFVQVQKQSGYSTYWDETVWDENFWSDEFTAYYLRASVSSKAGSYISLGFYGKTKEELVLYSTGLIIKDGGGHIQGLTKEKQSNKIQSLSEPELELIDTEKKECKMSFVKKVSSALFGSTGPKYSQDKSALTQQYGVQSDLGNMRLQKNADGTYSKVYTSSDIDKQRNALASQGLGTLSLDPTDVQRAYYNQATNLLSDRFDQQQRATDEALINRGIQTGTEQYNKVMGNLTQDQNQVLQNIANQAVYQGYNTLGQQIGNINALTSGRDVYALAGMGGSNNAYDSAYQGSVYNDQLRNQRNQNIMSAVGAIAGGLVQED